MAGGTDNVAVEFSLEQCILQSPIISSTTWLCASEGKRARASFNFSLHDVIVMTFEKGFLLPSRSLIFASLNFYTFAISVMNYSRIKAFIQDKRVGKREKNFPEVIRMTSRREKSKDARGFFPSEAQSQVVELIIGDCRRRNKGGRN